MPFRHQHRTGHELVCVCHREGRKYERHVNDHLPHDRFLGYMLGIDESLEQMDRGDPDQGRGQFDLEHTGADVRQPLGLIRVALEGEPRDEGS